MSASNPTTSNTSNVNSSPSPDSQSIIFDSEDLDDFFASIPILPTQPIRKEPDYIVDPPSKIQISDDDEPSGETNTIDEELRQLIAKPEPVKPPETMPKLEEVTID